MGRYKMSYSKKIKKLFIQSNVKVNNKVNDRIIDDAMNALEESDKTRKILISTGANIQRFILWRKLGYIAATLLVISSITVCFILYEKVISLKTELKVAKSELETVKNNTIDNQTDESVTINFYLPGFYSSPGIF